MSASSNPTSGSQPMQPQHPPYLSPYAGLGGLPTTHLDVPITAVFLLLFLSMAVTHMTILQVNQRREHKFILSGLLFGFSMARIVTCIMRIIWATKPQKIPIAIAAQVFVSAGVVLLFIVNLIFTQRIIRALHPQIGWHRVGSLAFKIFYTLIVFILAILITVTVQMFYSLNTHTRHIDHSLQLFGATFFAVMAFLPIPLITIGLLAPRKQRVEKFGASRFRHKVRIVLLSASLLTLGAAFRAGTAYEPRPRNNPAWYHSKACFYIFNFTVEWLVLLLFAVARVDLRFHVPDGSKGPGDYSRGAVDATKDSNNSRSDEREFHVASDAEMLGEPSMDGSSLEKIREGGAGYALDRLAHTALPAEKDLERGGPAAA